MVIVNGSKVKYVLICANMCHTAGDQITNQITLFMVSYDRVRREIKKFSIFLMSEVKCQKSEVK